MYILFAGNELQEPVYHDGLYIENGRYYMPVSTVYTLGHLSHEDYTRFISSGNRMIPLDISDEEVKKMIDQVGDSNLVKFVVQVVKEHRLAPKKEE